MLVRGHRPKEKQGRCMGMKLPSQRKLTLGTKGCEGGTRRLHPAAVKMEGSLVQGWNERLPQRDVCSAFRVHLSGPKNRVKCAFNNGSPKAGEEVLLPCSHWGLFPLSSPFNFWGIADIWEALRWSSTIIVHGHGKGPILPLYAFGDLKVSWSLPSPPWINIAAAPSRAGLVGFTLETPA